MPTRTLDYRDGALACEGYLAEPEGDGPWPGVLVVHEAPGLTEHAKRRSRMLADLGYVALAADMFGGGTPPIEGPGAMQRAAPLMHDRSVLRARARAGLDALAAVPRVDPGRVAAIGYCFGGSTVIELARDGISINGIASFHGGLKTPSPARPGVIRTKMLICTGAADPTIPAEDRQAAQEEFSRGGGDWQMIVYAGAKHAFTNRDAPAIEGFGYHADADRRSWDHLLTFLAEIFA